jgi:hypothetical protein
MAHLSVSPTFLVFVSKPAVSLQPAFTLSPLLSPPPQHLADLQSTIILALTRMNGWMALDMRRLSIQQRCGRTSKM